MSSKLYVPRAYQATGEARMIATSGFGLFVEPGGGKTVTTLTAADRLMHETLEVERTLVVAPKMVAQEVWWREAAKWSHTKHLQIRLITAEDFGYVRRATWSAIVDGEEREIVEPGASADDKAFLARAKAEGVAIARYEMLVADPRAARRAIMDSPETIHVVSRDHLYNLAKLLGDAWPYRLVLGDESTSFKTHDSKRSKAIRYLRKKGLISRLVLMSGTPMPKSLEQLWAQVLLLDNGERLGDKITHFRRDYLVPDKRNKEQVFSWKPAAGAIEAVMTKVSDICLSVRADIWRQNEPPRVIKRPVQMPAEAMAAYETMEQEFCLSLPTGDALAANAGVLAGKLAQIASGFVFDGERVARELHDAKMDALEELVEELGGEPLLVLYWFKPSLVRLKKRFPNAMTTKTPGFIEKFGAGLAPMLLLHPGGAGHGLDGLQHGGHHVAVLDLHPDWELYKQAVDRLDRSGQKHQVTVTQLVASGTNDEAVSGVLFERGADNGKVMDAIAWRLDQVRRRAAEKAPA